MKNKIVLVALFTMGIGALAAWWEMAASAQQHPLPAVAGINSKTRLLGVKTALRSISMSLDINDSDHDGASPFDNCPKFPNLNQLDNNRNGIGDACELKLRVIYVWNIESERDADPQWRQRISETMNEAARLLREKYGIALSYDIVDAHTKTPIGGGYTGFYISLDEQDYLPDVIQATNLEHDYSALQGVVFVLANQFNTAHERSGLVFISYDRFIDRQAGNVPNLNGTATLLHEFLHTYECVHNAENGLNIMDGGGDEIRVIEGLRLDDDCEQKFLSGVQTRVNFDLFRCNNVHQIICIGGKQITMFCDAGRAHTTEICERPNGDDRDNYKYKICANYEVISTHHLIRNQWVELDNICSNSVPDSDGDGVLDDVDNCRNYATNNFEDMDGDGRGDYCDIDRDGDGILDNDDNCIVVANHNQADRDHNGRGDACDAP